MSLFGLLAALCLTTAAFAQGEGEAQTQALVRRLQEGDRRERLAAAEEIKARGASAKAAAPALSAALKDPDDEVRKTVAEALGRMGPEALSAVPALIGALSDGNSSVRSNVAFALGQVGAGAEPAIPALPALNELQNDQATVVRLAVVEAINKISSQGTGPQN